ncbi:MAG: TetR/AcrR family transcriptional regulator [Actinomycetota bacterium]
MPSKERSRRPYDAPRRRAQALATRAAVVAAARAMFVDRGYGATTIGAIAARAGVSSETVYALFRTKRGLLAAVVDASIAGDDEPVPVLERPWVHALRDEPDVERRVRLLARGGRAILERIAPIHRMLVGAAAVEPGAAEVLERYTGQRLEGQRALVRIVAGDAPLRPGVSMRAAVDTVFAIGSPETYSLLVDDRGWTPGRFERWYADTLIRLLLPDA